MKKFLALALVLCLAFSTVGCKEEEPEEKTVEELIDTSYYILKSFENKGTPYQIKQSILMTSDDPVYNSSASTIFEIKGNCSRIAITVDNTILKVTTIDDTHYLMLDNDGEVTKYKMQGAEQNGVYIAEAFKMVKAAKFSAGDFVDATASYADGVWTVSAPSLSQSGIDVAKEYLSSITSNYIEITDGSAVYTFSKSKIASMRLDINYYPSGSDSALSKITIVTEYSYDDVSVPIPEDAHLYENLSAE